MAKSRVRGEKSQKPLIIREERAVPQDRARLVLSRRL